MPNDWWKGQNPFSSQPKTNQNQGFWAGSNPFKQSQQPAPDTSPAWQQGARKVLGFAQSALEPLSAAQQAVASFTYDLGSLRYGDTSFNASKRFYSEFLGGKYLPFGAQPTYVQGSDVLRNYGVQNEKVLGYGGFAFDLLSDPLLLSSATIGVGKAVARSGLRVGSKSLQTLGGGIARAGSMVEAGLAPSTYFNAASRVVAKPSGAVAEMLSAGRSDSFASMFGKALDMRLGQSTLGKAIAGTDYLDKFGASPQKKELVRRLFGGEGTDSTGKAYGVGIKNTSNDAFQEIIEFTALKTDELQRKLLLSAGGDKVLADRMNQLAMRIVDNPGAPDKGFAKTLLAQAKLGDKNFEATKQVSTALTSRKAYTQARNELVDFARTSGKTDDQIRSLVAGLDDAVAHTQAVQAINSYKASGIDKLEGIAENVGAQLGIRPEDARQLIYAKGFGDEIYQSYRAAPQKPLKMPSVVSEVKPVPVKQGNLFNMYRKPNSDELKVSPVFLQNVEQAAKEAGVSTDTALDIALKRKQGLPIDQPYQFVLSKDRTTVTRRMVDPGQQPSLFEGSMQGGPVAPVGNPVPAPSYQSFIDKTPAAPAPENALFGKNNQALYSNTYRPGGAATNNPYYDKFFSKLKDLEETAPVPLVLRRPDATPLRSFRTETRTVGGETARQLELFQTRGGKQTAQFGQTFDPTRAAPTNDPKLQQFFDGVEAAWKEVGDTYGMDLGTYVAQLTDGYAKRLMTGHIDPDYIMGQLERGKFMPYQEVDGSRINDVLKGHVSEQAANAIAKYIATNPSRQVSTDMLLQLAKDQGSKIGNVKKFVYEMSEALDPGAAARNQMLERLKAVRDKKQASSVFARGGGGFKQPGFKSRKLDDIAQEQASANGTEVDQELETLLGQWNILDRATSALGASGMQIGKMVRAQDFLSESHQALTDTNMLFDDYASAAAAGFDKTTIQRMPEVSSYGPLAGKYVPRYFYDEVASMASAPRGTWSRNAQKLLGMARAGMLGTPRSTMRDIVGNFLLLDSAGVDVANVVSKLPQAWQKIKDYHNTGYIPEMEDAPNQLHFLRHAGIAQEIQDNFVEDLANYAGKQPTGLKAVGKMIEGFFNPDAAMRSKIPMQAMLTPASWLAVRQRAEEMLRMAVHLATKEDFLASGMDAKNAARSAAHLASIATYDYTSISDGVRFLKENGLASFPTFLYKTIGRAAANTWQNPSRLAFNAHVPTALNDLTEPDQGDRATLDVLASSYLHEGIPWVAPFSKPDGTRYIVPLQAWLPFSGIEPGQVGQFAQEFGMGGIFAPLIDATSAFMKSETDKTLGKGIIGGQFGKEVFDPQIDTTMQQRLFKALMYVAGGYVPQTLGEQQKWAGGALANAFPEQLRDAMPQAYEFFQQVSNPAIREALEKTSGKYINREPTQEAARVVGMPSYKVGPEYSAKRQSISLIAQVKAMKSQYISNQLQIATQLKAYQEAIARGVNADDLRFDIERLQKQQAALKVRVEQQKQQLQQQGIDIRQAGLDIAN